MATIAVAMLPELEKAAKERQKAAIKERDEKGRAKPLPQKSGEVDKHAGESTAQAAAVVGVGRSLVETAKMVGVNDRKARLTPRQSGSVTSGH